MNAPTPIVDQQDLRLARVHQALRGISALAYSETEPDEALNGRRGDLSSLLDIVCEELEYTITGNRPLL
jgi:hypothetical protein